MGQPEDVERAAIEHDRDLAWDLYEAQPEHPRIAELTMSVLAREPSFTGMIILLALHRKACGEVEEARRLLRELMGRRDRQYVNAVKKLRDLEYVEGDYAEALRLSEIVLRERPDSDWMEWMEYGSAWVFVRSQEEGWQKIDDAVEMAARTDPDEYAEALGQRAVHFLATGAPPERFLVAAEEAIAADPSEPILATALAYAYLYAYRPWEAEELLRRVLREDPTDEVAQGGMIVARGFIEPVERGDGTMEQLRAAGLGEIAWRILRDGLYGTGLDRALPALDAVMPAELAGSLRPPLDREAARASSGVAQLLAWHDGQEPGSGGLWGDGEGFRLMSAAEIADMDAEMERDPAAWPQWEPESEYFTQLFTDDAGAYAFEGPAGRVYRRCVGEEDRVLAPSLADWVWDRVVAFGGADPRPGRS